MNIFIPDIYAKDGRLSWSQKIFLAEILKITNNGLDKVLISKKHFLSLGFTAWQIRTFLSRLKDLKIISTGVEKDKKNNACIGLIVSINNAEVLQAESTELPPQIREEEEGKEEKEPEVFLPQAPVKNNTAIVEVIEAEPIKTFEEIFPNVPAPNEPPQKRSHKISGETMSQKTFFDAVVLIESIMRDVISSYMTDNPDLTLLDAHAQAQAFVNHYSSTGWKAKGSTTLLKDIGLTVRNWLYRATNYLRPNQKAAPQPLTSNQIEQLTGIYTTSNPYQVNAIEGR